MEEVALTVSPAWTELESLQANVCRDDRQEAGGALTSLGKMDGHRRLTRFPGFLGILEPARLLEATGTRCVWVQNHGV